MLLPIVRPKYYVAKITFDGGIIVRKNFSNIIEAYDAAKEVSTFPGVKNWIAKPVYSVRAATSNTEVVA